MAKKGLPNWQARQKLLYSKDKKGSPTQLATLGEEALSKEQYQDALDYFRVAGNQEGLERLKKIALDEGDTFLLFSLERATASIDDEFWNRVGQRAFELGKLRFAQTAFKRSKNETMLAKIPQPETSTDDTQPPRSPDTASV